MTRTSIFQTLPARERYKLLLSTIVPQPIAWIVTLDQHGRPNAAPFSFFNAFAVDPPVVGVGIGIDDQGCPKDTQRNIRATKQFVVNLVSEDMAEAMNIMAIDFESGVSELSEARGQYVSIGSYQAAAHCRQSGSHGMRIDPNRGPGQ